MLHSLVNTSHQETGTLLLWLIDRFVILTEGEFSIVPVHFTSDETSTLFLSDNSTQLDATLHAFVTAVCSWLWLISPKDIVATKAAACSALFLFFSLVERKIYWTFITTWIKWINKLKSKHFN